MTRCKLSEEPIYCFNGKECVYAGCDYFQNQLDNCGFKLFLNITPSQVTTPQITTPKQTRSGSPKQQPLDADYSFINTLREGDQSVKDKRINIRGQLLHDPYIGEANTRGGPKDVSNIVVDDGTGELKITFWEDQASKVQPFKQGDEVVVENIYKITKPYKEQIQANAGKYCIITKQ